MTAIIDNTLKRKLKAGHRTAGAWLQLCSPIAAEIMADAGFDWLLIDMEHGHGGRLAAHPAGGAAGPPVPGARAVSERAAPVRV